MEFRKMVTTTLYARQQKRHRYREQTFGLCGRRRGWDDLREQHWNMYITICEIDHQSKFDAWNRALKASALGQPRGVGWGGRREWGLGRGTHVHPWLIHVNVWQKPPPQYCKVISLQLKKKNKWEDLFSHLQLLLCWVQSHNIYRLQRTWQPTLCCLSVFHQNALLYTVRGQHLQRTYNLT